MQQRDLYCAQLVRDGDRDRYLAGLFAGEDRRPHLFALYAFNVEIARVRELVRQPPAGEVRLQWWREAIEQRGRSEVRANPAADALLDTISARGLSEQMLFEVIEARRFDLYNEPMPTLGDLDAYMRATSSAIMSLAAATLDSAEGAQMAASAADHAGIAYAVVGLLRALPIHAARGQLYVPLDLLERHRARPDDIVAGKPTPEVRAAINELCQHAHQHLAEFKKLGAQVPPQASPAFLPAALVPDLLARIQRVDYNPFAAVDVPQWRRQWTLWRAARRNFPSA